MSDSVPAPRRIHVTRPQANGLMPLSDRSTSPKLSLNSSWPASTLANGFASHAASVLHHV